MKIQSAVGAGIAGIVLIGIAAALLGGGDSSEGKIRIAFFPNIGHAIPIVGTEQGFFTGELETRVFDSGPQAVESLFANSIDMAYVGPGPAVNGFLKSDSDVIILAGAASGGSSLIVHPDSGIESASDLHNKVIAAPQIANTQDVSMRTWLAQNDLTTADRGGSVLTLNVANPEIYTLFSKGDIDAAWLPEPWATMLIKELDGKRLFFEEELWNDNRFASVLLVARADFVSENPDLVEQWLADHEKIVTWINENPDDAKIIFNDFMAREFRTIFSPGVVDESFENIEITSDVIEESIAIFAQRSESLGYLGRDGYNLEGIFYDNIDVNSQELEDESWLN